MRQRNTPLKAFASPIKQKGPTMPKDHPVKPKNKASDYETEPYDGPMVNSGSAPNPAKAAYQIGNTIYKGGKALYNYLSS
jgi:hypothetical protein